MLYEVITLLTVLFAWACVRLYSRPSRRRAGLVGVIGALACLTRITALSFVAPTILVLAFTGDRTAWWRPNRRAVRNNFV